VLRADGSMNVLIKNQLFIPDFIIDKDVAVRKTKVVLFFAC
jgi:hypothetical protein